MAQGADPAYVARFRRKYGGDDGVRRYVAALYDVLASTIGTDKVVLHHAETEAALRWGLAHGIRRFQGRHVDAMLGASRIVSCGQAEACTLRQCIERAGAAGRVGRAGCVNCIPE